MKTKWYLYIAYVVGWSTACISFGLHHPFYAALFGFVAYLVLIMACPNSEVKA